MKRIFLTGISIGLIGCAQTMTISDEKLGESRANLKLDASALDGYVSVPLINSKTVGVYLEEFPDCIDGKPKSDRSKELGNATLTPKKNTQTVPIPSGNKLLVSSSSHENVGGNTYTCWNSVHFTPEKGREYILKVTPHKSFGSQECTVLLMELIGEKEIRVESAVYPEVEYKGFWAGEQFNHCEGGA